MKRNNAFAVILLGIGLSIGCNSSQQSNANTDTNTTTTTHTQSIDATNNQPSPQYCENNCEEHALYEKPLHLTSEEQNSLAHALKQSTGAQTHIEGTAVNGGFQFHSVPGPARISPDTPQIAVPSATDPKQIVRIPLTPEAAQLARPRTGTASH